MLLVLEAECTAFTVSKVPSSRVKVFRLPRGMVVNGVATVKPARAMVTKSVNADFFNMTRKPKVTKDGVENSRGRVREEWTTGRVHLSI